jgi:transcriptional antiterminator RfaH
MKDWYILNTKLHCEFQVINYLINKNIKNFMPKLLVTRRHARKIEKVLRPLFPGYVFININVDKSYREVNNIIGVKGILSSGNTPSCVSKTVINEIQSYTDCKGLVNKWEASNYKIGQEVKIKYGIFKGNIGSFCGMSSKDRVSILLAFLGSEVRVSISSLDISAA